MSKVFCDLTTLSAANHKSEIPTILRDGASESAQDVLMLP
jgi:hypothetical protein